VYNLWWIPGQDRGRETLGEINAISGLSSSVHIGGCPVRERRRTSAIGIWKSWPRIGRGDLGVAFHSQLQKPVVKTPAVR
jgi:hypothetical protein